MKKIIFIIVSLISIQVCAQTDTKFWFVAPYMNPDHGGCGDNGGQPIYLRFTTTADSSTITISQPANPAFTPIVLIIPPNSTVSTNDLYPFIAMLANVNLPGDNPNIFGIYITASTPVSAYYEAGNCNTSEIYVLMGNAALGDTFYIPGPSTDGNLEYYYDLWGWATNLYRRSFDIVATEDNTVVQINPTTPVFGYYPNIVHAGVFVKTLNKGETYSCWVVDSTQGNKNFGTGSYITSNKPIAITRSDEDQVITNKYGMFADLNGKQIVPIQYIGSSYIINRGDLFVNNGGFDLAYVTATQANTKITLTGATFTVNGLNALTLGPAGSSAEVQVSSPYATANSTDQPFYCYHVSGVAGEDAAALIPPVDQCTGTNQVGFYRTDLFGFPNQSFKLHLIIRANAVNPDPELNFQCFINGVLSPAVTTQITTTVFTQINVNWKVATIDLSNSTTVGSTLMLTNSSARFLLGMINGDSSYTARYGYFAGFGDENAKAYVVGPDSSFSASCTNQSVRLLALGGVSYKWSSLTGGFTVPPSQVNMQSPLLQFTSNGTFQLKVLIGGVCDNLSDSAYVTINVTSRPATPVVSDLQSCLNSPVPSFDITNAGTNKYFAWYSNMLYPPVATVDTNIYNPGVTTPGEYTYYVEQATGKNTCLSYPAEATLTISEEPDPTLVLKQQVFSICSPQTVNLSDAVDTVNSKNLATLYTRLSTTGWTGISEVSGVNSAISAGNMSNLFDATGFEPTGTLSDSTSIKFDMQQIQAFGRIVIKTPPGGEYQAYYPAAYYIYVSNNPNAYSTTTSSLWTYVMTDSASLNTIINLPVIQASRYIKIQASVQGVNAYNNAWYPNSIAIYNRDGCIVSYYSNRACTNPVPDYTDVSTVGWYYLKAGSGQCSTLDSVDITGGVKPNAPVFSDSSSKVCAGESNVVYTVINDPNTISYNWRYTGTGATISNGTTNSISIDFAPTATAGNLWAIASNSCGKDSVSMAISFTTPSNGGTLSSSTTICSGSNVSLSLLGINGTIQEWQSSTNGGTSWTNIADVLTDYTANNITQTTEYQVVVQNAGCPPANSNIVSVTVQTLPVITSVTPTNVSGCGLSDGIITVSATPAGSVDYSIDSLTWQTNNIFSNLSIGFYYVWVKNSTGPGCPIKSLLPEAINNPSAPSITNSSSTNITDCGKTDGTITIVATGGTDTFEFYIYKGADTLKNTTGSFIALDSGTYHVMVEYSNLTCPVDGPDKTITSPVAPIPGSIASTNVTNCGINNGMIHINVSGGLGSYLFSIDNGTSFSDSGDFRGLSTGHYGIKVKNSNGTCVINDSSVNITAPGSPKIDSVVVTNISNCNMAVPDGKIQVYASGGNSPGNYDFTLNSNPAISIDSFTNLSANSYDIKVTNPDGSCVVVDSGITVTGPVVPQISKVITNNISTCDSTNGSIDISATGGSGILQYSIEINIWQSDSLFTGLDSGIYLISVRYQQGGICVTIDNTPQIIQKPIVPIITGISKQDKTSCKKDNGLITITAQGSSLGTLQYSIKGDTGWSNQNTFTSLDSGSYQVSIKYKQYSNTCLVNSDTLVKLNLICTDTIQVNLCNTLGTYDLFNAFNPPLTDKSGIWKDSSNQILQDTIITIINFSNGVYTYYYYRTEYYRDLIFITVTVQQRSGVSAILPVYCNRNVNLFETLQDSSYDPGGKWLSGNVVIDSIAIATPGTNIYFYYQKAIGGCSAKSTSVIVYVDSIPPLISCNSEFKTTLEFLTPYYVVAADSLTPTKVSDNCYYTLKNNITNDSMITGAHIENSTVVKWTATDSSGNSSSCDINVILKKGQIPNTISPNGDGINDYWDFKLSEYYPNAIVQIYNRWGEVIWVSDKGYDTNLRYFDGHDSQGKKVPVDSYEYLISDDGKIISKGFISVIY